MKQMKDDPPVFSQQFTIRPHETDKYHRLTPQFLMWLLQETAVNHVETLNLGYQALIDQDIAWALGGFYLEIKNMPILGESIEIKTWHKEYQGLFSIRDFELYSNDRQEILVGATSSWFLMNIQRRRPVRIEPYMTGLKAYNHSAVSKKLKKPRADEMAFESESDLLHESSVYFGDLDHNDHANNVHYLRWMMNSLPADLLENYRLSEFEIYFLRELNLDDHLSVRSQSIESVDSEQSSWKHQLVKNSEILSAGAFSHWKKC